jgi:hypothetical protein
MGTLALAPAALVCSAVPDQLWALGSTGGLVALLFLRLFFKVARLIVLAVIAVAAVAFVLHGDHWQSIADALQPR